MPERTAIVGSSVGLHARPAAVFVQAAAAQALPLIGIAKPGGEPVDARSILSVLSLEVHGGDTVVLTAEGAGADAALDELAALLATDLDAK